MNSTRYSLPISLVLFCLIFALHADMPGDLADTSLDNSQAYSDEAFADFQNDDFDGDTDDDDDEEEVGCCDPVSIGDMGHTDHPCAFYWDENEGYVPYSTCSTCGVLMPECPVLFKPLLADPRQVWFSVGWRFNDQIFVRNVIDVSYADLFPIYRWWNLFFCGDALEIDLEGALWAIFDPLHDSSPLINADYYGGMPITYAYGPLSFRLRLYHISSHLGDEFLLNNPNFNRMNPSAEYIDLFASYQFTPELRIYAGYGYIMQRDISFPFKRNYIEWGAEAYFRRGQFFLAHDCLSGVPYFALHFRARQDNDWHEDGTYVLGYEFRKHSGLCRKLRVFMQYHQGFSCEGQFARQRTDYFSLRASYWY